MSQDKTNVEEEPRTAAEPAEVCAAGSTTEGDQIEENAVESTAPIKAKSLLSDGGKHSQVTGTVLKQASDQANAIFSKMKKAFNEKNHY
ncbi:hypothetical protein MPTK1_5g02040 [Marchantia polymorpha subsp. ruderalis]|uniref:Uncharacterized protein n=1 Tax=Marchantia polymorpha subsp. ruderalis TaxID=1480154 RepID=A0AAF6BE01_MARPO|nr:hypothetical protein Mp_5g02040 [Marchantia polymorpha subsp. ruderalis]